MSAVLEKRRDKKVVADQDLLSRLCALFSGAVSGNMGPDLYRNGGAQKFESIIASGVGKYTPFSGETELLKRNSDSISEWAEGLETAVIIGPGPARSVRQKEIPLLKKIAGLKRVIALELSPAFNAQSAKELRVQLPHVEVHSFEVDFRTADLSQIANSKPALVISTGSFTNYENCQTHSFPQGKVLSHIGKFAEIAGAGGKMLWGYNSELDPDQYNRPIIDDFLMYPLVKASNMDGVMLDPDGFKHETLSYSAASILTHYWTAVRDQDVEINGIRFPVNAGERFPMFFSVAQSPERLVRLIDSPAVPVNSSFFKRSESGAVVHGFDCV